jgi:hypothetical protein
MAKPGPDRGDVDGSAPNELTFVVAGSNHPVAAELAEGALDSVEVVDTGRRLGY